MGDKRSKQEKKLVPALVYNAKFQALVKNKGGNKTTTVTNEELDFLRQAEMDKDIEDEDDDYLLDMDMDDEYERKKKEDAKKKAQARKAKDKKGNIKSTIDPAKSVARLRKVANDLQSVGTNSTAEQSVETSREPITILDKWKSIFTGIPKKEQIIYPRDSVVEPSRDKRETALHRVTAEQARKIRKKQARKRRCMEQCTYHCLVLIIFVRLVTTLEMIYEQESYYIILEYLKVRDKVNCLEVYGENSEFTFWTLILLLYFLACCILPIVTRKELTGMCIVWMFLQMLYTSERFFLHQKWFFYREFHKFNELNYAHTILDVFSFTVVMIRYYYWANPSLERDRYSNTMLGDYLVNEYIQFMVQSSFIRKKNAVQRATAFQIMTVVRKLKEKYTSSGKGPSNSAISKEVKSAIHALQDWKKFPALRIIHSFEVKEKIMKEKLKLRRQRIREMKERFHNAMKVQRAEAQRKRRLQTQMLTAANTVANKVIMTPRGQAVGVGSGKKSDGSQGPKSASRKSKSDGKSAKSVAANSTGNSAGSYSSKRAQMMKDTNKANKYVHV